MTPKLKAFARRLVAYNAGSVRAVDVKEVELFQVCEKLRQPLIRLTGAGGFRSLLSRALAMAAAEVRWLRAVQIAEDGSLEGVTKVKANLNPQDLAAGEVAVVAQLIGLLVTFIGADLTVVLLRNIWPGLDDLDL